MFGRRTWKNRLSRFYREETTSCTVDNPVVKKEGKSASVLRVVGKWLSQTSGQNDSSVRGRCCPQKWFIYSSSTHKKEMPSEKQEIFQINHQPDATIFQFFYPDVYLQLNMFRAFSRPSSGAQWLQWQPLVLLSYRGDSRAVYAVGPAGGPDHEHSTTITTIRR